MGGGGGGGGRVWGLRVRVRGRRDFRVRREFGLKESGVRELGTREFTVRKIGIRREFRF